MSGAQYFAPKKLDFKDASFAPPDQRFHACACPKASVLSLSLVELVLRYGLERPVIIRIEIIWMGFV